MAGQLGANIRSSKDDQIQPYLRTEKWLRSKRSNLSTSDTRIEPTDKNMDNLAWQELKDPNRRTPQ